ncbi:MAG: hypothetical protein S4CHLAM45_15120 [Chlamydiales bacterium]|nr:hypothetical protein [Chlamydiales bacterium]MCH9620129.1 hypothetical protein [Chlamydiales bacterium]MCH9623599.1 hypothetical protein [Chlamydiales bacterium]
MTSYNFKDFINYYSEKLNSPLPQEDIEEGIVDLFLEEGEISLFKGATAGSIQITLRMGEIEGKLTKEHLLEMMRGHFLGLNTAGFTFALREGTLFLLGQATSGVTPQESWELLERLISIGQQWNEILTPWKEYTSSLTFNGEQKDGSSWRTTSLRG